MWPVLDVDVDVGGGCDLCCLHWREWTSNVEDTGCKMFNDLLF